MAVNLSPVGGVAAQFFTNDGVPLAGGLIYTYAAGTNTPVATYTSASGSIAHSNPIVLDSAGRVPSGEIWLTDGVSYKFVLKDANDALLATYDNIVGINSNFVNYTSSQEIQTATAGQTVFTLTTMQYQPGTNSLSVFVDGVNQYGPGAQYAYVETSSTVVTFVAGLHVGASVKFTTTQINSASYGDAFQISYTPPFTGSVATNVGDTLAQTVSVMDFGADPTGSVDSTAAIQAAIDSGKTSIFFPQGNYIVSAPLQIPTGAGPRLFGAGNQQTTLTATGSFNAVFLIGDATAQTARGMIDHMYIYGSSTINYGIYGSRVEHFTFESIFIQGCNAAAISTGYGYCNNFIDCEFSANAGHGIDLNVAYSSGGNNAIEILGCRIFGNDKFGIKAESGYGIFIDGCTIEANKQGGIHFLGINGSRISAYFEKNGTVGYTYTTPSVTVKSDIILASAGNATLMSNAFPCNGIIIEGCSLFFDAPHDSFVWNAGGNDVSIKNIYTTGANGVLLAEMYDSTYKGSKYSIENCSSFTKLVDEIAPTANKENATSLTDVIGLQGGTWPLYALSYTNYANLDFNTWGLIVGGSAANFVRSDTPAFKGLPIWNIQSSAAGSSNRYGFSINAASYPELQGQLMWYGLWLYTDNANSFPIPYCSLQLFNVNPSSTGSWQFRSATFTWPSSGTIYFGAYKAGSSTGSTFIAAPMICPVGFSAPKALATVTPKTQFRGAAAPTVGVWNQGDIVWNSAAASGQPAGWMCVTSGTPGTWKAMANLA
jgi:hypothetical protein